MYITYVNVFQKISRKMPVLCTDCDDQNYDHKQTLYFLFLAPNANENSCALDSPDI